jgi:hypothetical protein
MITAVFNPWVIDVKLEVAGQAGCSTFVGGSDELGQGFDVVKGGHCGE